MCSGKTAFHSRQDWGHQLSPVSWAICLSDFWSVQGGREWMQMDRIWADSSHCRTTSKGHVPRAGFASKLCPVTRPLAWCVYVCVCDLQKLVSCGWGHWTLCFLLLKVIVLFFVGFCSLGSRADGNACVAAGIQQVTYQQTLLSSRCLPSACITEVRGRAG